MKPWDCTGGSGIYARFAVSLQFFSVVEVWSKELFSIITRITTT